MYQSTEHALYRAFNVSELFYQRNQLADLYRAPDWESYPIIENRLTRLERIHQDAQIYRIIHKYLPDDVFHLLRIMYCRSLDVEEWRFSLHRLTPIISTKIGRIKFNPMIYEYTCIKKLTGNKLKSLRIHNDTARRNSKRVCAALSEMTESAHRKVQHLLEDRGILHASE